MMMIWQAVGAVIHWRAVHVVDVGDVVDARRKCAGATHHRVCEIAVDGQHGVGASEHPEDGGLWGARRKPQREWNVKDAV